MTLNEKQLNSDNQWEKYVESGFDPEHEAPNATKPKPKQPKHYCRRTGTWREIPKRHVVSKRQSLAIRIQER